MGAYKSSLVINDKEAIKNVKPSHPEWVFRHAEKVQTPFVEALRCWRRFVSMGCNKKGLLTKISVVWKSDNIFMLQILQNLPWSKKSTLTFQTYLQAVKWYSALDDVSKLKVLFNVINDGNPIGSKFFFDIFKRLYPDKTDEEINQLVSMLMSEANPKQANFIDEEEFMSLAKQLSAEDLSLILQFKIIPVDVFTQE